MTTPEVPAPAGFEAFGLRAEVLTALKSLGYEEPTPIQRETIPALLSGRDVLGQAATGTGKTAAFALPMLQKVTPADRRPFEAQALVLVPTRELAMQVAEAVQKYGAGLGVTALAVYGGQEIFNQIRPLKRGVDVVVATPGRALDHIARKSLLLSKVKVVVLDEADEMLDMGFEEDLQSILNELPGERQTALFSATLAPRIAKIAEKHLQDPVRVTIAARSVEAGTLPNIRQSAYVVQRKMKEAALMRVLEWETPASAIIFCRTRNEVEQLTHVLMRSGYEPAALHGGLTQEQRDAVLKRFKEGELRVLVATDVAARGLHVENLSHVVNFDLPTSPEVYVHRIGRTGRAGKEGIALSFLDPREMRLLQNVERLLKKKVQLLQVPTRAQLDGKRAETVASKVQEALEKPEVAPFLALAQQAAAGSSMETVAAAAMWLLQQKLYPAHDSDQADFPAPGERGRSAPRGERFERGERAERGPRGERPERGGERAPSTGPRPGFTALTLSLGTRAGVRPQDLVGAIANEADVPSKQIHGIRVDTFTSRVEVPSDSVERVISAMHATKIRGRKVRVELEKAGGAAPRERAMRLEEAGYERKPRASAPRAKREFPAPNWTPPPEDDFPEVEAAAEAPKAPRASAPRREAEPAAETPRASAPRKARATEDSGAAAPRVEGGERGRFGDQAGADQGAREEKPRFDKGARFGGEDKPGSHKGARFGGEDKPRYDRDDKGARFGGDKSRHDKGARFGGGDKPRYDKGARFGGGDKPRFEKASRFGAEDKPRYDKGARLGGDEKPRYDKSSRFGGDEKPRYDKGARFGGDEKPRHDKGARFGGDEKPRYDKGARFGGGDKPRFDKGSRFGGDEKPRYDKGARVGGGEKPRFDKGGRGGEAGERSGRFGASADRPGGAFKPGRFAARPGDSASRGAGRMGAKPGFKKR